MAGPLRMCVPDSWHPVVNRGSRGECILRTINDRGGFRVLSEFPGRCSWCSEDLGVGWTDCRIVVSGGGSRVKRIKERRTRDPTCERFIGRL
jgi:hypothetical protein